MINTERLCRQFMQLVQIDSISRQERNIADYLITAFSSLDCTVIEDHDSREKTGSNAGNLIVKVPGDSNENPVLFAAHMDTVVPGRGIEPIIKEGVICSKGNTILGADNKAAIAALLEVTRVLKETETRHRPYEILITVCEEIGLLGAKACIVELLHARTGFALDSGGPVGTVIIQGPTQAQINIRVLGKAAHAGVAPEQGISAVAISAEAISKMKHGRIDDETTANIGTIRGGEATNIVCPEVSLTAEARSLDPKKLEQQVEHMQACFEEAAAQHGAEIIFESEVAYPAFRVDKGSQVVQDVKRALQALGIGVNLTSTGGGSDVNILNGKGFELVNLGIGMIKPHTTDEAIRVSSLEQTARLIWHLVTQ